MSAMAGWSGVPFEPAWQCDYCGYTFSASTGPLCRDVKREHRQTCTTPDTSARLTGGERATKTDPIVSPGRNLDDTA